MTPMVTTQAASATIDNGRVTVLGSGRMMRSKAAVLSADRAAPVTGRYLNKSNMYEYFTVKDRSVRSGRSNRSYRPRVSV